MAYPFASSVRAQESDVESLLQFMSEAFRWLSSRSDDFYGWNPSLNRPIRGQSFLRQAGALAALARGVNALSQPSLQSFSVFDESTTLAIQDKIHRLRGRRPNLPSSDAHPVGFAALLLLATVEGPWFPSQSSDAAAKLAGDLKDRQRPDGTIRLGPEVDPNEDEGDDDLEEMAYYPGEALYAIARYNRRGNTSSIAIVERAFEPYRRHWREHRQLAFIPWQTGAFAEAYFATQRTIFADFVFEMNDWLLPLQYTPTMSAPVDWIGGFDFSDGRERFHAPPGATTGSYAEALVDAWRVATAVGDRERAERYESALIGAFRFLMSIQYTTDNTMHFQPELRAMVRGAVHAGVDDGSVRIDFTQHALMAASLYLVEIAESPREGKAIP